MAKPTQKDQSSSKLLQMLVCPQTGGSLSLSKDGQELISLTAKIAYPIRDGIPIMIESEARRLSEKELKR